MTTADWALVLSLFSVTLALAGFIWNVWSKFIYPKAKVRTSFGVMNIHDEDGVSPPFLVIGTTNYGPGAVTIHSAIAAWRNRRLFRRTRRYGLLNPLHNFPTEMDRAIGPFGGGLPKKLDVGETFSIYLIFEHEHLRDDPIIDVGVSDTFGRYHWAPRKQVRSVIAQIRKDFPRHRGSVSC